MNLIDNVSFLEMEIIDLEEYPRKRTKVNCDSEALKSMRRADKNSIKICFECSKRFSSRIISGALWPYKDKYQGKQRWYCSWTCLCRNRKGRGNDKRRL